MRSCLLGHTYFILSPSGLVSLQGQIIISFNFIFIFPPWTSHMFRRKVTICCWWILEEGWRLEMVSSLSSEGPRRGGSRKYGRYWISSRRLWRGFWTNEPLGEDLQGPIWRGWTVDNLLEASESWGWTPRDDILLDQQRAVIVVFRDWCAYVNLVIQPL